LSRLRQTAVAGLGVTFGITMFITLLSFMTGLNDLLDGLVVNRTPHIRLYKEIKPSALQPINLDPVYQSGYHFISSIKPKYDVLRLPNSPAMLNEIKRDSRVLGVAPKVAVQVFYNIGAIDLTGVINGVDVLEETRLFKFNEYVTYGNYLDIKNVPNSIILGKSAADQMMVKIGDIIQVTTTGGARTSLKVVGFFQSGLKDIDKVQSYAAINTVQTLLGENSSYYTDLQIKLHNILQAPAMAKEYRDKFGIDALDIQTANAQFDTGTFIRTLISYVVGITLLIVAGFGIYNILNMMIYEKLDSIAILKAAGFSGKDVRVIFIGISVTLGLAGGLLGLIFGYLLSTVIDQIPFVTEALPTITTYPINYNPKFYIIAIVFALSTTFLAGYFPARKAGNIDPVIIIRGK
jgi:lipoprotein-releasing system permease protein